MTRAASPGPDQAFAEVVCHATALRHELHRHPERTWQEAGTAARIRGELDRLGIAWWAAAEHGTIADLGPPGGNRIALRADIDGLPLDEETGAEWQSEVPGTMHACGHDGHTASLLATAAWLKRHDAVLARGVRLLFQPAEEGGHGAKKMIEDGALEGVTRIYGYHNLPTFPFGRAAVPVGPVMVANGYFVIDVRGRGTHASTPDAGRDPLLAAAHFVTSVQQVVARNVAPQKAAVVTVSTFHGGTAKNIIPDSVRLEGTIRAGDTALRAQLAERVEEVLAGVCQSFGVEYDYDYRPAYSATVNEATAATTFAAALAAELGPNWEHTDGVPFMGGEDFSYYLAEVSGAYALIGSGKTNDAPPLHSPRFDFEDELIPLVVRLYARLVGAPPPGD